MRQVRTPRQQYIHDLERSMKDWASNVPCKELGPKGMYPPSEKAQQVVADSICKGCPSQLDCLVMALSWPEDAGVWGGATEAQRKTLFKGIRAEYNYDKYPWCDEVEYIIFKTAEVFVRKHVHGDDNRLTARSQA